MTKDFAPAEKVAERSPPPNERRDAMGGSLEQFTMTLPSETLMRVDRMARDHGMTRAALLSLFVHRGLDRGLS
jgi:hypothetical protein